MFLVKGFGVNASTAINTPGIINFFGELSTQSLTYTKEKGIYKNPANPGVGLISFLSKENDQLKELPIGHSDHICSVIGFIYGKVLNSRDQPFTLNTLLNDIRLEFANTDDVRGGVIESDNDYMCPDWISWKYTEDHSLIKIWFIDSVFQNQYDEFILEFAPSVEPLDSFFSGGIAVENMLAAISPNHIVDKIQEIKDTNPETFIKLETYNYHDPEDEDRIIPTHWGVLGYGIYANNIDTIREHLQNYILSNSTRTREQWAEILPDLFKKTEFTLIPLWNHYAIEPRTTTPGIYSPISTVLDTSYLLKTILPEYTPFQIDSYMTINGFPYKSIAIASIGHMENRNGKFKLTDYFPDFINVSSTSLDFNRMNETTKLWSLMIHELVMYAETATPTTSVPLTISKIDRDGILYLSRMYNNVQYLVATKYSIENI